MLELKKIIKTQMLFLCCFFI